MEACEKQSGGRTIELVVNWRNAQLAVMVKNSFDGNINLNKGHPAEGVLPESTKGTGGIGLKSVQAVAARYAGELLTKCNQETFTAYVIIKL